MATKTISVDLEAYERLRRARRSPDESFSKVIKRAQWPSDLNTAQGLLQALRRGPTPAREVIEALERAQRDDAPPEAVWRSG
jgi:hypothetical protein